MSTAKTANDVYSSPMPTIEECITEIKKRTDANKQTFGGKYALALSKAQGEFKPIVKDSKANLGTYSYNYAPLPNIIDATRPALVKYELACTQIVDFINGQCVLITMLIHSSGEFQKGHYPLPDPAVKKPQEFASYLTYARRYQMQSMLGVAADEDDDGNLANGNKPAAPAAPGDFVMPFGKGVKGLKLKDIPMNSLLGTKKWCAEKDAKKFESLINAVDAYIATVGK